MRGRGEKNFAPPVYMSVLMVYYKSISRNASHDHKETQMPVLTQVPVQASKLKIGDKVTLLEEGIKDAEVISCDAKTKWSYLELAVSEGLSLDYRLLNETVFQVERQVPTPEEEAAKDLQRMLLSLDFKEGQARKTLAHVIVQMIELMASGGRADHWHWMDVPQAQAQVELWDAVAHVHRVHAQGDSPLTRVEAVRMVRDERRKQVLSYYSATSRSTSVVSNLFDDIKMEALSAWTRELEWIIVG